MARFYGYSNNKGADMPEYSDNLINAFVTVCLLTLSVPLLVKYGKNWFSSVRANFDTEHVYKFASDLVCIFSACELFMNI